MISCGDPRYGFAFYQCPHCDKFKIVPFRCHSRFCNTCGVAYQQDRSHSIALKMLSCRHRHIVFTIPDSLRNFFYRDRNLLNVLFQSAAQVVLEMFHSFNKSRNFRPGIVCSLHTFGRDLKWNPHIHMLVTEGGMDCNGFWRPVKYFSYARLRKSWMTVLLRNLKNSINPEKNSMKLFKKLVNYLYSIQGDNGFYVHAPRTEFNDPDTVAKYITRYIGRPVMAQSRITGYDGTNVSYWYQRHEDNKKIYVDEHAHEFIKKLIIHIPEPGFNMLRYYGIYALPDSKWSSLRRRLPAHMRKIYKICRRWQWRIDIHFKYDPLKCECGHMMQFVELYNPCNPVKGPPVMIQSP